MHAESFRTQTCGVCDTCKHIGQGEPNNQSASNSMCLEHGSKSVKRAVGWSTRASRGRHIRMVSDVHRISARVVGTHHKMRKGRKTMRTNVTIHLMTQFRYVDINGRTPTIGLDVPTNFLSKKCSIGRVTWTLLLSTFGCDHDAVPRPQKWEKLGDIKRDATTMDLPYAVAPRRQAMVPMTKRQ